MVPNPNVSCSLTRPDSMNVLDCERAVTPTSCGSANTQYGPELMFSHVFPKLIVNNTHYHNKRIGITKVAVSGTVIKQWLGKGTDSEYGQSLYDAIDAGKGTIEAFVWFQGTSDHTKLTTKKQYLKRLKKLVNGIQRKIYNTYKEYNNDSNNNSSKNKFKSKKDIPVVIVELGPFIGYGRAKENPPGPIIKAQRKFVLQ